MATEQVGVQFSQLYDIPGIRLRWTTRPISTLPSGKPEHYIIVETTPLCASSGLPIEPHKKMYVEGHVFFPEPFGAVGGGGVMCMLWRSACAPGWDIKNKN